MTATNFSAGTSISLEVDADIQHDEYGLPFIGGKRLKGLLRESCDQVVCALRESKWREIGDSLFGTPGSNASTTILSISNGELHGSIRNAVVSASKRSTNPVSPSLVLSSLTEIRHNTRIDYGKGVAADTSLRDTRALIPGLSFHVPITWTHDPLPDETALFAATVINMKRGGLKRNRGMGRMTLRCLDEQYRDVTWSWVGRLMTDEGGIHG